MFAFHMIEIIENVRKEIQFDELNMRIGLHFGNIIGGVIGSDIIRFDIYGEDVMLANKMESEGEKGRINISEDLKNILQQYYDEFEY
jgi:class 3 adenylate cyclase